jgi:hypothetical protein
LPGNEGEQGADCCQSGIAGSGSAMASIFKMIEGIEHEQFVDLFNEEILDIFVQRVSRVAEEQLNGIAVSKDGIGRKALLNREIVAEETLYELGEQVFHIFLHDF